jgi:phenylalanyl-tRNA synthetase beta chain
VIAPLLMIRDSTPEGLQPWCWRDDHWGVLVSCIRPWPTTYPCRNAHIYLSLNLDRLLDAATRSNRWAPIYKSFPTVPASERDLAVVVDRSSTAGDLIQAIRKAGKPLLEHVELIDRFEGNQLGEHKVSQAFRLRYRSQNETLTDDKIQPVHEKVRAALSKQFNAELRS